MSVAYGHAANDSLEVGEVALDEVVVVVSAVELHTCAADTDGSSFRFELVPSAHAHVPSSSTRLGVPAAAALFEGREASRVIGELSVPLERFCSAWIVLAPADDDVLNVTTIDDATLVGSTLVAASPDGTVSTTSSTRLIEVELSDPNKPGPLQFDKPGSGPMLLFDLSIEPIDEQPPTDTEMADFLLERVEVSLRRFHDGPQ